MRVLSPRTESPHVSNLEPVRTSNLPTIPWRSKDTSVNKRGNQPGMRSSDSSVADTKRGADLAALLDDRYDNQLAKHDAVVRAISASGPAPAEFSELGATFATRLQTSGKSSSDWNCAAVGCYFSVVGGEELRLVAQDIQHEVASSNLVIVTPNPPDKQIIILVNGTRLATTGRPE